MLLIHAVDGCNYLIKKDIIRIVKSCGNKIYIYVHDIDHPIVTNMPYDKLVVLIDHKLASNIVVTTQHIECEK